MFDYLQQFNKLPKDIRSKISEKVVMSKISELEKKYQVDLAALVMKVMVKQVPYKNIALYLVGEKDFNEKKAEELSKELKETVFKDVSNYLDDNKGKNVINESKGDNIDKLEKIDEKEDPQELINQITKKKDYNIKIDTAIKDIINKADVSLSSSYLHDRLHMVLFTYIKGVRNKITTRSTLSRSGQEGGLSLDNASIDKLLKLADEYKKSQESKIEKPKSKFGEEAEKINGLGVSNETYNLKDSLKLKDEGKVNERENNKEDFYKKLDIKREIAPPSPVVSKSKELLDNYKKDDSKEELELDSENKETTVKDNEKQLKEDKDNQQSKKNIDKQEDEQKQIDDKKKSLEINNTKQKEKSNDPGNLSQETRSSAASNLSQVPVSSGKKSMQDIKVSQRIMGPIDELRFFNLKNFRRLSSDPQEAFSKIKEKIDLLSKESYEKGVEGIQAWRENVLNKLYYQITIESINQSKPVSEVIKERQEKNRDYLSNEELKALVSFNRSLMF